MSAAVVDSNTSNGFTSTSNIISIESTTTTTTTTTTAFQSLNMSSASTGAAAAAAPSYVELLFTTKSNIGWILAAAMPTGWFLILILVIMVFFSMPFIRKRGLFQVFYLTHWLHIFYFILLFIHAPNFWKWFLLPFLLLVFERIFTCFRVQSTKFGDTYIRDVRLLSSKVSFLILFLFNQSPKPILPPPKIISFLLFVNLIKLMRLKNISLFKT